MLQQLGRGGRDGKHTECVVYYDKLERAKTSVRWVTPMLMLSAENMGRGTELKF